MSQFIEMFGDPLKNPKNFAQRKLGDVATLLNGRAYKASELLSSGRYLVLRVGNFFTNTDYYYSDLELEPDKYCDTGDILYSWSATLGAQIWKGGKVIYHYHIWKVLFDENILNKEYFCFMLNVMTDSLKQETHGSTMVHLTKDGMEKKFIAIPPLELQRRFVSIAEQADKSGFDGRKSQFIEMFGIAKSTKPLADFIEVSFPGEWGQEDKDGSGVKVIRTTNFTNNGKLDLSDVVTRDIDSAKIEKKKLFKGDIILERSGGTNDNPVGRVVYFEEDGVYLFNNFTQLLRCKEGVNSLFIFYSLFNYYQMNKNVIRSMGNKTTGIQNLKMDRYWQIPIADVSTERQKEFESIFRQADKSGFELRKSIEAIDKVIKSLVNVNL